MNEITLVGDGLRYTVITGSRSAMTGFTTHSSATVASLVQIREEMPVEFNSLSLFSSRENTMEMTTLYFSI
ncbi:hypothetical protein CsSME_00051036 [Camellia sinensis var. sinensis]